MFLPLSDVICVTLCVCRLINHGQQPMKIHTEVTLLYKTEQTTNKRNLYRFIEALTGFVGHGKRQKH